MKKTTRKQDFKKVLKNWLMFMHPSYGILLKIVCCKLVMKYVERRKEGETMGIHDGGMKRWRKQCHKRKWHIKRCAKIDQRKTRLDIRISKIKQRKWLLILRGKKLRKS